MDFSADYKSRYDQPTPTPPAKMTARQALINAAAHVCKLESIDLKDTHEVYAACARAAQATDSMAEYFAGLSNHARLLRAVVNAAETGNYIPPHKPRLALEGLVTGNLVLQRLRAHGIYARTVNKNRQTGILSVRFQAENVTDFCGKGIQSSTVYARRITDTFDGVQIVDTYDTVAEWRPNHPVLFATVFLRIVGI